MRGSIVRQGNGSWGLRVSAGFDPVTGKRKRLYRTVRGTKRQAEAELAKMLHEVATGSDLDPSRLSFSEYLDRWLEHMRTRVRPKTWRGYSDLVRLHVRDQIGSVRLGKVRPAHVQAVVDGMVAKGMAARSVVQCYAVLTGALKQARRWQLIATNPAEAVRPPRPARPTLEIPDADALARLIRAASGTDLEIPVLLDAATGLRRGELLGLRWRDVDLEAARLRVNVSLQRVPNADNTSTLALVEPKTDRARREIALPKLAVDALRRHRKQQAERRLLLGEAWTDLDLVFDAGDGSARDPDAFSAAFRRLTKKAKAEGVRLHDVRHGYATALLAQGVHPKIASEALGHASVAFTLDTYSHVVAGLQEAAARAIEASLNEAVAREWPETEASE